MCGILGHISFSKDQNYQTQFNDALEMLNHRGPDHTGIRNFELKNVNLSFGHKRLSIIDLSDHASQPFYDPSGRYTLIYNGEIYNYKELRLELQKLGYSFKTNSDTEVFLFALIEWGEKSLNKFIGMFSFAFFDKSAGKIFIARDAYGIKPLYFRHIKNKSFSFSSEIKPILKLMSSLPKLNKKRSYEYLVHGLYDHSCETFFEDIYSLEPGHSLIFNIEEQNYALKKWWNPSLVENLDISFYEAAEKLRCLFLDSLKIHLRSDVPIGIALSGGIDSSAIACGVRHLDPDMQINTFSYISNYSDISEANWIKVVNSEINAVSHEIDFTSLELESDLEHLIEFQGEPFGGTSIYAQYRVFKKAKEKGIKVTLEGQGADEIFGGYNGYPNYLMQSMIEKKLLKELFSFFINGGKFEDKSHFHLTKILIGKLVPGRFLNLALKTINRDPYPSWIKKNSFDLHDQPKVNAFDNKNYFGRRLMEALYQAQTSKGLPTLLRHGDRNSMISSIEGRVPFLNTKLSEFVFSLPEKFLVSDSGLTKSILRSSLAGIVPDQILDRKDKIGFQTPELRLLNKNLDLVKKSSDYLSDVDFIDHDALNSFFNRVNLSSDHSNKTPWRLVNFALWHNKFF